MTTPTSMPTLTKMTKVEVVVSGSDAPAVRDLIQSIGATGYTSLSGVSGLGHNGYHQGRLLFNQQATLELIITVVPEGKAEPLLAGLRPLLDASSGVMFVTETFVSRPDYFS
jgi:nitrogen regulatory protein PII